MNHISFLGRTNVNQTSDFDIAPPSASGPPSVNIEDQNTSENTNTVKTPTLQITQSASNAKTTPDRDTGSATPLSCSSSTAYSPGQANHQTRLSLSLCGPNLPGIPDVEIELTPPTAYMSQSNSSYACNDRTVFQAVQALVQTSLMGSKV